MVDFKSIPKVDMKKINAYMSPRALNDFNVFLEKLPQNAGKTILIAAGIAWGFVAALGLFTTIKAQDLNNLRAQLQDAKALKPIVPQLTEVPVAQKSIEDTAKRISETYKGLDVKTQGNTLSISAPQTNYFGPFREAVLQTQNGGAGWKVGLKSMCVGRECKQKALSITLKIDRINIDKPESSRVSYLPGMTKPKIATE